MSIEIANARDYWDGRKMQLPDYAVYVGRRNNRRGLKASLLENPDSPKCFVGRTAEEKLRNCLRCYRICLQNAMAVEGSWIGVELDRLRALHEKHGKLVLVCWCVNWDGEGDAPGLCHAEEVREELLRGVA